ncbi:Rad2 nuclease [Stylosanthes scabra]|uniref:Rad2 nuclease n=1 Tax=Stylosanthes scabra TaxID=79078 RepID=A0ABU6QDF6_9FABA|nr:Rad2 nuclease [Stylosanthes scabra]
MGIQGLLPQLKSIMSPIHIKELQGCSVAVDTYSWLHKGALSCSTQLCKNIPTNRHIEYCMHRVNLLRHFGINPILVFDGGLLPMKAEQENKRARVRKENFARAVEHESNGNNTAAFECYQKAVDISPLIARELIQVLRQENVQYVVAPYEADAQMAFLAISGKVDAVITEDSDLIPFGCPRIIFKMDKFGQGVEFRYSMLHKNKELCFEGFDRQMLLEMCILSGCDYLQSLPDIAQGIAKGDIDPFTKMPFEGVNLNDRSATAGTSQFKTLHSESVKKKIDLPVQKNLLTKYFCFASVEAKRNFRAPRVSPTPANQGTFDSSSTNSMEHETSEAMTSKTKNSTASLVNYENSGSNSSPPPANDFVSCLT